MKNFVSATLFNVYVDSSDGEERWQRRYITRVQWNTKIWTRGEISKFEAVIFIPQNNLLDYVTPLTWKGLADKSSKWTLQVGDILVKGIISAEIKPATDNLYDYYTVSDLKEQYSDVRVIARIQNADEKTISSQGFTLGVN